MESRKKITLLGCGLVGQVIARDLAAEDGIDLCVVDRDETALAAVGGLSGVETRTADLSDSAALPSIIETADLVVGAVPGQIGGRVMRAVIEAGRPLVDISFSPDDPLELDGLARARGVTAVVDCGVAPGLSNVLVGRCAAELDEVQTVRIYVGGLPYRRVQPYEYRIVFSPTDVIEEYVRPCRLRLGGLDTVRPALSDVEQIDFPQVGTLEAFNTDGLRTLLRTIDAPNLSEKTLRYPGHATRMRMLRDSGFFDEQPILVGPTGVPPRALTEQLLFQAWKLPAGEREFTLLRVVVEGLRDGRRVSTTWDLYDSTDDETGFTSMARTTGFPCAIVAKLVADGRWVKPGVHPPETLGADETFTAELLAQLADRGVRLSHQTHTGTFS